MINVVCWNIDAQKRREVWDELFGMDADVALLQEVKSFPEDIPPDVEMDSRPLREPWDVKDYDRWPTIIRLSRRVKVEWFQRIRPYHTLKSDQIGVSGIGTLAAARVTSYEAEIPPFIVASMYARWMFPNPSTNTKWSVGFADGSAHRIISDLSAFIGSHDPSTHRILAAGDLNTVFGVTTDSPQDLPERNQSIFDRFQALGFEFVGPQSPNGRMADTTPKYLSPDTKNVPTFALHKKAENAVDQLDYVFASRGFHESVQTCALNRIDEWGPSDHCRILIEVS
ncbi:MAG: hypothetical protein F4X56_06245 [Gammaproteobacteria bacterium]|nr:hypothetical protein [Gammaproteobacteria bacterium]MYC25498.1 hypothetical protein [Gammaproteobacteria bacterium]